jgi:hypothetical protein
MVIICINIKITYSSGNVLYIIHIQSISYNDQYTDVSSTAYIKDEQEILLRPGVRIIIEITCYNRTRTPSFSNCNEHIFKNISVNYVNKLYQVFKTCNKTQKNKQLIAITTITTTTIAIANAIAIAKTCNTIPY